MWPAFWALLALNASELRNILQYLLNSLFEFLGTLLFLLWIRLVVCKCFPCPPLPWALARRCETSRRSVDSFSSQTRRPPETLGWWFYNCLNPIRITCSKYTQQTFMETQQTQAFNKFLWHCNIWPQHKIFFICWYCFTISAGAIKNCFQFPAGMWAVVWWDLILQLHQRCCCWGWEVISTPENIYQRYCNCPEHLGWECWLWISSLLQPRIRWCSRSHEEKEWWWAVLCSCWPG